MDISHSRKELKVAFAGLLLELEIPCFTMSYANFPNGAVGGLKKKNAFGLHQDKNAGLILWRFGLPRYRVPDGTDWHLMRCSGATDGSSRVGRNGNGLGLGNICFGFREVYGFQ